MKHPMAYKINKGFTLIEVLLSLALIAVIVGIGAPVYQSLLTTNQSRITVDTMVNSIRRAQLLSQSGVGDSAWGINLSTTTITLFKGASYDVRDETWDEVYEIPATVTVADSVELVFSKLRGAPDFTGDIDFVSNTGVTSTVSINDRGIVSY